MVNIVVVSHSKKLAEGVVELASQMTQGKIEFAIAAGIDDLENPIGTDPISVLNAIESVRTESGVIILLDMGSAILSTDTALELLTDSNSGGNDNIKICAAPIVEGTVAAAIAAASGSPILDVFNEAQKSIFVKFSQLGQLDYLNTQLEDSKKSFVSYSIDDTCQYEKTLVVTNPNGIHARPSSAIATTMSRFESDTYLGKNNNYINAKSVNNIALLSVKFGDEITFKAVGVDAQDALLAFNNLVDNNFGDKVDAREDTTLTNQDNSLPILQEVSVFKYGFNDLKPETLKITDFNDGFRLLRNAIEDSISEIDKICTFVTEKMSSAEGAIFLAHKMMLDDDELFESAFEYFKSSGVSIAEAWVKSIEDMVNQYKSIDDPYLRDRYIDVYDIGYRVLSKLNSTNMDNISISNQSIILSNRILPSQVIYLDPSLVKGIMFQDLEVTSHPAILAARMNIPIFKDINNFYQEFSSGDKVTFNRKSGIIFK